jgi:hypothetical protein
VNGRNEGKLLGAKRLIPNNGATNLSGKSVQSADFTSVLCVCPCLCGEWSFPKSRVFATMSGHWISFAGDHFSFGGLRLASEFTGEQASRRDHSFGLSRNRPFSGVRHVTSLAKWENGNATPRTLGHGLISRPAFGERPVTFLYARS